MKPYGHKDKKAWCDCIYCVGRNNKSKKAVRHKAKKEISEYKLIAKPSKPSFSKKYISDLLDRLSTDTIKLTKREIREMAKNIARKK